MIWNVLAPLLALTLAAGSDAGGLRVVNARPTYGHLGAPRPKTGMLPGDLADFAFEVKGLKLDAKGQAQYSIAIEVIDQGGKVIYRQEPYNAVAQSLFGGDTLPCTGRIDVPLDAKPGPAFWKVTVKDRAAGSQVVVKGQGKILPADFGLVRVGTYADPELRVPMPPVGVVGQPLYVSLGAVGFTRTGKDKQPNVEVSLRVLDAKGRPTTAEPMSGAVTADVPATERLLSMQFGLTLSRPGRFTIELTARDRAAGKTSRVTLPVHVLGDGGTGTTASSPR